MRWAWANVHLLPAYLRSLQPAIYEAMQRRGQEVWEKHFKGEEQYVATVMQIIEHRARFHAGRRLSKQASHTLPQPLNGKAPEDAVLASPCQRREKSSARRNRVAVLTWSDRLHEFAPVEQVICGYCARHGYDRILSATWRNASLLSGATWQKVEPRCHGEPPLAVHKE